MIFKVQVNESLFQLPRFSKNDPLLERKNTKETLLELQYKIRQKSNLLQICDVAHTISRVDPGPLATNAHVLSSWAPHRTAPWRHFSVYN